MNDDYIEKKVEEVAQETYGGDMPEHNKSVLRDVLKKEDKFWEREGADFIRGFDDGEPQTTVDYNHYNGATE